MGDTGKTPDKQNNAAERQDTKTDSKETITQAHEQAEKDIEKDPDFQPDPAADLDEGELARLEGED
jgi:hypothetical protein